MLHVGLCLPFFQPLSWNLRSDVLHLVVAHAPSVFLHCSPKGKKITDAASSVSK